MLCFFECNPTVSFAATSLYAREAMDTSSVTAVPCHLPLKGKAFSPAGGRTTPSVILPRGQNATSPIATQRWRQGFPLSFRPRKRKRPLSRVISTEEAKATERRNLLDKQVGSQIPPLASLGRDDKKGKSGSVGMTRRSGPPRASAPTVGMTRGRNGGGKNPFPKAFPFEGKVARRSRDG